MARRREISPLVVSFVVGYRDLSASRLRDDVPAQTQNVGQLKLPSLEVTALFRATDASAERKRWLVNHRSASRARWQDQNRRR
jgi:hypothetical protein